MAARRPYRRSMEGWWNRDPFFKRYMAREVTAFFVAAYGLVMLVGLVKLAQGPAAFGAWLGFLRSAPALLLHAVLFLAFLYHTYSWFEIMPKTMPPVVVGGKRVAAGVITSGGIAAALVASAIVLLVAWRLAR